MSRCVILLTLALTACTGCGWFALPDAPFIAASPEVETAGDETAASSETIADEAAAPGDEAGMPRPAAPVPASESETTDAAAEEIAARPAPAAYTPPPYLRRPPPGWYEQMWYLEYGPQYGGGWPSPPGDRGAASP
jgi:hypothetical protein